MKALIPVALRDYVVSEIRTASRMMREESDLTAKVYYFSTLHGAISRALNVECSNNLVLLLVALQITHTNLSNRVNLMRQGADPAIKVRAELFEALAEASDALAHRIEAGEDIDEPLEKLVAIGYATTGNGYYLYRTGRLTP